MPIANCYISSEFAIKAGNDSDLLELWAKHSKQSAEEMTINLINVQQQLGKCYSIMAQLLLPNIWSTNNISLLQTGLAKALSIYFQKPIKQIIVVTILIASGNVVESGKEISW
jgi:hypothetical protein